MHTAGQAIDPVTVTWEAARLGVRTDPGRLAGGIGSFAVADAREVRRLGTLAQIARAGSDIQADAAAPARALGLLLEAAGARLEDLLGEPQPGRESVPPSSSVRTRCRVAVRVAGQPEREAAS
jgi:hypothetical protein